MTGIPDRAFSGHSDFMLVRQFLIDSYSGFDHLFNWGIDRWEVFRYSGNAGSELAGDRVWERFVRLWEDGGRLVGVAHPEDGGDLHVQIDADHRYLENEMFAWGEEHRSPGQVAGALSTWVRAHDSHRREVLRSRGWKRIGLDGYTRRRSLLTPLPAGPLPDGYLIRSLDLMGDRDAEGRAAVSRAAFGTTRTAEMARVLASAPSYRPDLDLAAIAGDGTFAAYTTVWLDEVNRFGVLEPVGTHPDHRRIGLASAVMAEGMRRAAALGAETAYVGCGDDPGVNRLYEKVGFVDVDADELWEAPRSSG